MTSQTPRDAAGPDGHRGSGGDTAGGSWTIYRESDPRLWTGVGQGPAAGSTIHLYRKDEPCDPKTAVCQELRKQAVRAGRSHAEQDRQLPRTDHAAATTTLGFDDDSTGRLDGWQIAFTRRFTMAAFDYRGTTVVQIRRRQRG